MQSPKTILNTSKIFTRKISIYLFFIVCLYFLSCGNNDDYNFDIVIYGASPAGITAAIQAAKLKKSVVLIEPTNHVGGIIVEGLGATDIDNHSEFQNSVAIGGLALEFYKRVANHYGRLHELEQAIKYKHKRPELWCFEPHVAEKILNDWLGEYPIKIILNAPIKESKRAVEKKETTILSIRTDKGKFKGKYFIDASVEGDLLAASEISFMVGRESNTVYDETKNGIREHTTHGQFSVKVDPYLIPGNAGSGTIQGILNEPLGIPGSGDHRLQAYCFRVCLTNDPDNRFPLPKPENYDRSNYELALRYLKAGGKLLTPYPGLPNRKSDVNGGGAVSHNLNGMNYRYPEGSRKERKMILDFHKDFTQGFFYFLANDPEVAILDPNLQKTWQKWGLPKDEFKDNNGWPRMFYVRDARRMLSDYIITEHHAAKDKNVEVEDPVAIAFWPPDVHNVRTIVRDKAAYNEGFVFGGDWWKPFGISYRALIPKMNECVNLLTPTCPSSSHIAYGTIRIEWTFMTLGQSAALAASLAIDNSIPIQKVQYQDLKKLLIENKQVFDSVSTP
ncbi:FAD dependent oxidoreductase [Porphyromonadaceae bacterium KH3R12]|nr:FAD dependent oxidoreductase [Porphyromonadaceae bacterium KH3R12]